MNSVIAKEVLDNFAKLAKEDRDQLVLVLEKHFGRLIKFSLDDLSEMELTDLEIMASMIGGMILMKNYTPDIRNAYKELNGKELPSKISFGMARDTDI